MHLNVKLLNLIKLTKQEHTQSLLRSTDYITLDVEVNVVATVSSEGFLYASAVPIFLRTEPGSL